MDTWSLPIKLGMAGTGTAALVGLGIIARLFLRQSVPAAWIVVTTVLFVVSLGALIAHTVRIEVGVSSGNDDDDDDDDEDTGGANDDDTVGAAEPSEPRGSK